MGREDIRVTLTERKASRKGTYTFTVLPGKKE